MIRLFHVFICLLFVFNCTRTMAMISTQRPQLVVVIVIDQFRADNLTRFRDNFLPSKLANGGVGGFKYLMSKGAYFPQAQYDILQPMTGPGHATVLTGAYPYLAGIPANTWFDPQSGEKVYCVEDKKFKTVGAVVSDTHIGTSPRNLLGTTIGDELKNGGWPSRVVSIALKDRAAILLGGQRADIALWLDNKAFQWVSSEFYLPSGQLPHWVELLNQDIKKRDGKVYEWQAKGQGSGLSLALDAIAGSGPYFNAAGPKFPHKIPESTTTALISPLGLEMTAVAAEKAIENYQLGQGKATDILAISFSSHDYVGHAYGPNSRENEEMVIEEDRIISQLLNFINHKVKGGLSKTTIVLTADHGVAPSADWLAKSRIQSQLLNSKLLRAKIEKDLSEKFGESEKDPWILFEEDFNFWFNHEKAKAKNVTVQSVEQEIKSYLLKEPGFAHAFSLSDYRESKLPPGMHERRIKKTYFPGRSGDVIGLVRPFYYTGEHTANHLADYSYDSTVPLIIAGPRIKSAEYGDQVGVVDIAPTLAFLLGTIPPSLSEGHVLTQIIKPQ